MKKMVIMVVALLVLCVSAAFAQEDITTPREGPAVAAPEELFGTVALFDTIDDGGNVLMEYYSGARLEVTRVIGNGMVQVQSGVPGASIMGYMREEDLRYGAAAQRQVPKCEMSLELSRQIPIYGYCDELAEVIGQTGQDYAYSAMSRNDGKWVQLCDSMAAAPQDIGFLYLPTGTAKGELRELYGWTVDPLPGELTADEAYAAAIGYLLDNPGLYAMQLLPEELRTREGLMSMDAQVRLLFNKETGKAVWDVYLQNGEDYESNVDIVLTPEGEVNGAEHGNG